MSVRWKLLVMLPAIALIPLAALALLDRRNVQSLGDDLSAIAHASLIQRTTDHLQQRIRDQAAMLQRRRHMLEHLVRAQAREVERHLSLDEPAHVSVYSTEDYDGGANRPPDMVPSQRHFVFAESGSGTPIPVTYNHVVVNLAPGVSRSEVADDVVRLAMMAGEYRFLQGDYPELIFWQTTGLENGVMSSYPGHGGYPKQYDHRQREWYRAVKEQGRLAWVGPYFDASSEQVILTLGMPVRYADGAFAGVTAIDISVAELAKSMEMPGMYSDRALAALVTLSAATQSANPRARVVARPGLHVKGQRWDVPLDREWLDSEDSSQMGSFLKDLAEGKTGSRRMPYQSRNSLWVYGPVDEEGDHLVFILPYEDVLAETAETQQLVHTRVEAGLKTTGILAAAAFLAVGIVAFVTSRSVMKPIDELARAAHDLGRGNLNARAHIRTRDEFQQLGDTFNAMVPQLRDHLEIKHALQVAKVVQQHLLPSTPPTVQGLDMSGRSIYCDTTGGDYYDFIDLPSHAPGQIGVAVGDVTGHGVAAALSMTAARALLRAHASEPGSLAALMDVLNRRLSPDMSGGRYMSMFYMVFDAGARQVRWTSAGHDPAIVYDAGTGAFTELAGSDAVLGIESSWQYHEHGPMDLQPGQIFLIGTDGIWEARNTRGEFFGKDAMRDVVREHACGRSEEISQAIIDAVTAFRGDREQEDDLTLVVTKVAEAS